MIYNKEYLEQLLQRFMDGGTNEQEELLLTEYFSMSDNIPKEWEAYRELFATFSTDAYNFTVEELNEFTKENASKPRTIRLWPWLAVACVTTLLVVLLDPPKGEDKQVTNAEDSVVPKKCIIDSVKEGTLLRNKQEEKQIAQTRIVQRTKLQSKAIHPMSEEAEVQEEHLCSLNIDDEGDCVIQASTANQDPNLVTEFIRKLVGTCKAKRIELDCSSSSDKNASTDIYVFKEDERIDVFDRLIQVACWYDNTQPGYHLSLSNNQFIFELQDTRNGIQYMWFAERVRDNIILNSARASIGSQILSPCYRRFRRNFKNNYSM